MLSDLSHCISDILYTFFQMIAQMMLVFHRNSCFFLKIFKLVILFFFLQDFTNYMG